jgi:hypothetical protein
MEWMPIYNPIDDIIIQRKNREGGAFLSISAILWTSNLLVLIECVVYNVIQCVISKVSVSPTKNPVFTVTAA